ncbi:anti-sigma factor family protein [Parasediminibacterium sp. JCM 36343]|uniref:anti-sigma factor family protein n=1 Tax=Parasediminibacterium sp. JCM 36343 TaxID=3374279 RepID=UPI00397BEBBF
MNININSDNYEEYFLLYIDGELPASQKAMVEAFIANHPALRKELELLQGAVLMPNEEALSFDKSLLFKNINTSNNINSQNSEEQFLLYIDNELNEKDKKEVEKFLLQHPAAQDSFALLKQTKLEPIAIPHPNKKELYKKERKVVYMQWMRVAVAAVLVGLGFVLFSDLTNNNKNNLPPLHVVSSEKVDNGSKPTLSPENTEAAPIIIKKDIGGYGVSAVNTTRKQPLADDVTETGIENANFWEDVKLKRKYVDNNARSSASNQHNKTAPVVYDKLPIKDTDAFVSDRTPMKAGNNTMTAANQNASYASGNDGNNKNNPAIINNSLSQATVYKELNTDDDDRNINVGNIQIDKDKLRGFLRKASKVLGGNHK